MANSWHTLRAGKLFPEPLRNVIEYAGKAQDRVTDALAVTKLALEIAASVAALAAQDPLEAVLRETVAQIEAFIDGLLGNTAAHAIMIPIQKQFFGAGDPLTPEDVEEINAAANASVAKAVSPTYETLLDSGAISTIRDGFIAPETVSFINSSSTTTGGNSGYYRTLLLSLQDPGDYARPNFPTNYAVTGVSIVFGSKSLTDIYRLITLINKFLGAGLRADMGAGSQPVAPPLTARIVPIPSEGRIGVQLNWTPLPLFHIKPLFSLERAHIREIFVIRSTDPLFREAFTWNSVFVGEPTNDQSELPSNDKTKVLARLTNDGFRNGYVDTDSDLKIGVPYYYALSIRYTIGNAVLPMSDLSNVVRVFYNARPGSSRGGTPPDWYATASFEQLFPLLQRTIAKAKLFIAGLLSRTSSNSGVAQMLQQTIEQIGLLVAQAETLNIELALLRALINDLANAKLGGIYTTSFNVKTGGMSAWTSELAVRLSDPSEENRPPFVGGDLTAGFVIVAGAPNLPQLAGIQALMDLLFGDSPTNPITNALDVLGPVRVGRTGAVFNERMVPVDATADAIAENEDDVVVPAAEADPPKPVFDSKMQPATTLSDC